MSKKRSTTVERMLFESSLRQSIENSGRFDEPLSDMERKDFEAQIALLKETIRQNQEFINRLMDQLKEQGQKTEKAEHKVETLEHRIEELLDEIRQLNKRIKDLMDRDKRHNKMSMGKKSFKKHNCVESRKSRQEEKDDYDNGDAKKQESPDEKASSESESGNKEGQIDKTKVTSEFLDQKRSERGKYNTMEAAEVETLETCMDGAPANMRFVGMKTIEEYSKMSYIKCTKFVVAVYEDEYGIRHEYYAPQDPEDTRRPHENTIKGTHGTPDFMSDLIVDTCQIMTPLHRELIRMAIDKFSSSKQTLINWLETCAEMLRKLMPYIKADLLGKKAILNIDETWYRVRIKFKGDGTRLGHYFNRNDGHYTIDNMVAERAIRPFTVKRKGSMFFSSEKGVKNAMIFHTIIETCKQTGIMVKDYLTYVLSELNRGNKDYASLTPSKVVLK